MKISYLSSLDLHKDTPIIVRDDENIKEKNDPITFNFITEIFFMSHLSYSSSVHRLHRMLLKVYQNPRKTSGNKHHFFKFRLTKNYHVYKKHIKMQVD